MKASGQGKHFDIYRYENCRENYFIKQNTFIKNTCNKLVIKYKFHKKKLLPRIAMHKKNIYNQTFLSVVIRNCLYKFVV